MKSAWIAVSVLAGIAALWLSHDFNGAPYIGNDGYQYLDAASNYLAGPCFCTEVAHFDEQVEAHRLPLPFTHWAPGFPLLIAAASRTGLSLENSGYLLAAIGFLATIWLMWDLSLVMGARPWIVAAFTLLWITHASGLWIASAVAPEAPFAAILLAIATLMARDERGGGKHPELLLAIGALAGFAYWLRYAGLFLIPVAAVYIAWRFWRNQDTLPWALAGLAAAGAITATVQVRNIVYTGSWKGGFTSGRHLPPDAVFVGTLKAFFHMIVGDRAATQFDVWSVVIGGSLLILVISIVRVRRVPHAPALAAIVLMACVYACGVLATSLTSIASDFGRYYLPLYPLMLTVAAVTCSTLPNSKTLTAAVALMVLAVLVVQARNLRIPPNPALHVIAREELQQEVQPGVTARQWLQERVGSNDVLIAVNGQAVHYVLQRPVISLMPPDVSTRGTDDAAFRTLLNQWRARYLIVFPDAPSNAVSEQQDIPFLRELAAGRAPDWLALAAHAPEVAIYECGTCSP